MSNQRNRRGSISVNSVSVNLEPQTPPRERRNSVSFQTEKPLPEQTPSPSHSPSVPKGLKSLDEKINNLKPCQCDKVKSELLSDAQNRQKVFDLYKVSSENAISNLQNQVEKLSSQLRDLIEN